MMDPDYAMTVGAVLGASGLWIFQRLFQPRRRTVSTVQSNRLEAPEDEDRRLHEIGELHERLAILERIATDPAERTAREIEALR